MAHSKVILDVKRLIGQVVMTPRWLWVFFALLCYGAAAFALADSPVMVRYLLPVPFVLLALWAVVRKLKARRPPHFPKPKTTPRGSREWISSVQFQSLVGEAFRRCGFNVVENTRATAPEGVDLMLENGHGKLLVQCRQWKALQVGVPALRELYEQIEAVGAEGGYVVTCGSFSEEARQFAQAKGIGVVDGDSLRQMIRGTLPPETATD